MNPTVSTFPMCVVHSVRRYVTHTHYIKQTAKRTDLSPIRSLPDLPVHRCLCVHHLCWLFDVGQMRISPSIFFLYLCAPPPSPASLHPPSPSLHCGQLADFICDTCFARRSFCKIPVHPQNPPKFGSFLRPLIFDSVCVAEDSLLSAGLTLFLPPTPFFFTTCCS